MSLSSGRFLHIYHTIFLVILIGLLSAFSYYYFEITPLGHGGKLDWANNASKELDLLSNKNGFKNIEMMVNNGKIREANEKLIKLEKSITLLSSGSSNKKLFHILDKQIGITKKTTADLISGPDLISLFKVLNKKISGFNRYVKTNNWQTLERISKRTQYLLKTNNKYNYKNIRSINRRINLNIAKMKNITNRSLLSNQDKISINIKLDSIAVEVNLIDKYLVNLKKFFEVSQETYLSYKNWLDVIGPEISLVRVKSEKLTQQLFLAMLGIILFSIIGLIVGWPVYLAMNRKQRKEFEFNSIELIKDNLIKEDAIELSEGSTEFKRLYKKYYEYIHKRMSFGSMFQESIPFPAVLLDSNLKMIWANRLFTKLWELDRTDLANDSICWDLLQRSTNLGENDPVLESLSSKLAGIYQIQFRSSSNGGKVTPFEMYVTPVEYSGQQRVMLLFYSLESLEETISDQAKSIVGPVIRTLDALKNDSFSDEFKNEIKDDFAIAGIENVFTKFEQYKLDIDNHNENLAIEIEALENKVCDQVKFLNDISNTLMEKKEIQNSIHHKFSDSKNSIINLSELRSEMELIFKDTVEHVSSIIKKSNDVIESGIATKNLLNENSAVFEKVSNIRDSFKLVKNEIDDFKLRLTHIVDQSLIFKSSEDDDTNRLHSLNNIKLEVKTFEKVSAIFAKVVTGLDVALSKLHLIMEKEKVFNFEDAMDVIDSYKSHVDSNIFQLSKLIQEGRGIDDSAVDDLKEFYELFKFDMKKHESIEQILSISLEQNEDALAEVSISSTGSQSMENRSMTV